MVDKAYTSSTFDTIKIHFGDGADELIARAEKVSSKESQAFQARAFVGYAAPNVWGPSVTVATHLGVVTYTIEYEAVGDTLVLGQVTYWKGPGAGRKVTEQFRDSTTITTANAVATVDCEFKGIPLGSTVNGTCVP